jgi:hypothetical protein
MVWIPTRHGLGVFAVCHSVGYLKEGRLSLGVTFSFVSRARF